jgi:hypothetical protein
VRASANLVNELAERPRLYRLAVTVQPDPKAAADNVDAVVLDDSTIPTWSALDRATFQQGLEAQGFRRESAKEGIEVYLRGGR